MPVSPRVDFATQPDYADRTFPKNAHARQGRVFVVDVPIEPGVVSVDMGALGLTGQHVTLTVIGAAPLAYFLESRSTTEPPVQTTPDSSARSTFAASGLATATPTNQAEQLAATGRLREYVSPKFPMLQMNGVGGATTVVISDTSL